MRLKDKVAIVTGGGSGFGIGICEKFSQEGARVIVADINLSSAKEIANAINGTAIEVDVSDSKSMKSFSEKVFSEFGKIDILLNNAAGNFISPTEDLSPNAFKTVVDIVLNGTFNCTQAAGKVMRKNKDGVILNLSLIHI